MPENSKYLVTHSSCVLTKGFSRSLICDLQFGNYQFVPNEFFELLTSNQPLTKDKIYSFFEESAYETVREYLEYLEQEDYIFFTDEPNLFPQITTSWESSSLITNGIIDFTNKPDVEYLAKINDGLNELICEGIVLRFLYPYEDKDLVGILENFANSTLQYIEIHCEFDDKYTNAKCLEDLFKINGRLSRIVFFNCKEESNLSIDDYIAVIYSTESINNQCGNIHPKYFSISIDGFTEAHNFNSCLNRKIYINNEGDMKNCPHSKFIYGNIKKDNVKDIVNSVDFQYLWNIKKDSIQICKDCEFRYVCTDCRMFLRNTEDILSHPSKCTYNPYIAKWQSEKGYIPVYDCGQYIPGIGFVVDEELIVQITKTIWE